jgi:anti-sigma factor RsiW
MSCDRETLLSAYLDGELDLSAALELERHLEGCAACAARLAALRALRQDIGAADLRYLPSPDQARRLRQALGAPRRPFILQPRRLRAVAALLLVAAGGWLVGRRWPAPSLAADSVAEQVVATHVRSQLAGRPEDVASSDRHTVKPWFAGRLDYSPPVVDLAAAAFPLQGGRLEYVDGHPVAALVYRAGNHLVSVLVWPAGTAGDLGGPALSRRGFQLRHWQQAGMTWWAVSDAAAERVDAFVRRLRQELGP